MGPNWTMTTLRGKVIKIGAKVVVSGSSLKFSPRQLPTFWTVPNGKRPANFQDMDPGKETTIKMASINFVRGAYYEKSAGWNIWGDPLYQVTKSNIARYGASLFKNKRSIPDSMDMRDMLTLAP